MDKGHSLEWYWGRLVVVSVKLAASKAYAVTSLNATLRVAKPLSNSYALTRLCFTVALKALHYVTEINRRERKVKRI